MTEYLPSHRHSSSGVIFSGDWAVDPEQWLCRHFRALIALNLIPGPLPWVDMLRPVGAITTRGN